VTFLTLAVVCGVRCPLLDELLAIVNTIYRLRGLCHPRKETRSNYIQRVWPERCQGLVPNQFSPCQRNIYWLEKSGKDLFLQILSSFHIFTKQHLSIPVYTIFKNLTIILIVRVLIFQWYPSPKISQAYGEVIWFGGRVTALTFVSFIFMVCSKSRSFFFGFYIDKQIGGIIHHSGLVWCYRRAFLLVPCRQLRY